MFYALFYQLSYELFVFLLVQYRGSPVVQRPKSHVWGQGVAVAVEVQLP